MAVAVLRCHFDTPVEHRALSRGHVVPEPAFMRFPKRRRDDRRSEEAAHSLFPRPPEHLLGLNIPDRDHSALVHHHDSVERRVDNRRRAGFRLPELRSLVRYVSLQFADAARHIEESEYEERAEHHETELIRHDAELMERGTSWSGRT